MSKAAEQAITTVPSHCSLPHRRALLAGLAAIVPTAAIAATIPAMSSPEADSELIALGRRVSDLRARASVDICGRKSNRSLRGLYESR